MDVEELRVVFTGDTRDADRAFASVNRQTDDATGRSGRMGGAFLGAGGLIASGASMGAIALGGLAVAAGGVGVATASGMQQAQISFETMLGSAEEAETFLANLAAFAAKTPFEMAGLRESASVLVAAGIEADKVIPIMTTLGDVTSGMNTGAEGIARATVALQQMNAAGKISGEDLAQLRDAGIPVYDLLAAAMGKSKEEITELANQGKLGKDALDAMMQALESGQGLEKFSGLMDKQSQSMSGLWSTIKDNVTIGLGKFVAQFTPQITSVLSSVADFTAGLMDGFSGLSEGAAPIGEVFGTVFGIVKDTIGGVVEVIGTLIDGVKNWVDENGPLLEEIKETWQGVYDTISEVIGAVGDFIGSIIDTIKTWVSENQTTIDEWTTKIAEAFNTVGEILQAAAVVIREVVEIITEIWNSGFGQAVIGLVTNAFNTVVNLISAALEIIKGIFNVFAGIFTGDWGRVWEGIKGIFGGIWDAIVAVFRDIVGKIVAVFGGIIEGAGRMVGDVVQWFKDLPGKILGALGDLGRILWNAGKAIIEGLWNGLKDKWEAVKDWVGGIGDWISDHKGPIEYDRHLLTPHGNAIIQGLFEGLKGAFPLIEGMVGDINSTLMGAGDVSPTLTMTGNAAAYAAGTLGSASGAAGAPVQITVEGHTLHVAPDASGRIHPQTIADLKAQLDAANAEQQRQLVRTAQALHGRNY